MKKIIPFLILFSAIIISGCVQQVTCNPPYILVGTECCLDNNNNLVCDTDETTTSLATTTAITAATTVETTILETTTETTTEETTTVSQRVGALDVRDNFFVVCQKASDREEWCSIESYDSTNEVTIETGSLGAQEHNFMEIATWIYNKGTSDIYDIKYEISCDQTYPTYEAKVITGDNDKYKTVIPTIYFRCLGCLRGCSCTPGRYGQVINTLKAGDETTFRIELYGVRDFPERADLDCDVKFYSENPKALYSYDLIIHFNL
jgi:hypothetical protein